MIDINLIRENPEEVKKAVVAKKLDVSVVDEVISLDEKRRSLIKETEDLRAQKNKYAGEKNIEEGKRVKEELKKKEPELKRIENEFRETLYRIPNIIAPDVPQGKDENDNKVLRKWGEPTKFEFKARQHMELGETLDIIDIKTSGKVSGARFNYLKGDAVLLQFALIQFVLQSLTDRETVGKIAKSVDNSLDTPFIPVVPPVIAKAEIMKKMDRFDPIDDRYYLEQDDALLIGSAEHTLGPLHMDEVIPEKNLPIRYLGYSTAFRREAGTYGKDTGGILRVHQFDKVEMESFSTPEQGDAEQKVMIAIQEYIMQQLKIPYQVVILCTGDMGKPDYRQVDIEAWLPGQGKYRETHTSDYMTDYQSRRLNTRYRSDGETGFVHMNDATAIAVGRTIIAILENYQQADGSIIVPEVLRRWVGKDKIAAKV